MVSYPAVIPWYRSLVFHFGLTTVELSSSWTYTRRTSLMLNLHLSNFTYVGLTFVEQHSFWTYDWRTWLILDLQLSNLTHVGLTTFQPTKMLPTRPPDRCNSPRSKTLRTSLSPKYPQYYVPLYFYRCWYAFVSKTLQNNGWSSED